MNSWLSLNIGLVLPFYEWQMGVWLFLPVKWAFFVRSEIALVRLWFWLCYDSLVSNLLDFMRWCWLFSVYLVNSIVWRGRLLIETSFEDAEYVVDFVKFRLASLVWRKKSIEWASSLPIWGSRVYILYLWTILLNLFLPIVRLVWIDVLLTHCFNNIIYHTTWTVRVWVTDIITCEENVL